MELNFGWATGSWILGVALHKACGGIYKEVSGGQTLILKRVCISLEKLNIEIVKVPLVTDSKTTQVAENYQVIEMIETPAGDEFKMDKEGWKRFVEWLKSHEGFEVVRETEDEIELLDERTVYAY